MIEVVCEERPVLEVGSLFDIEEDGEKKYVMVGGVVRECRPEEALKDLQILQKG